jgi:hypothetical protein
VPVVQGVRNNGAKERRDHNGLEQTVLQVGGYRVKPKPAPNPEHTIHGTNSPVHLIVKMTCIVNKWAKVSGFGAKLFACYYALITSKCTAKRMRTRPLNVNLSDCFVSVLCHVMFSVGRVKETIVAPIKHDCFLDAFSSRGGATVICKHRYTGVYTVAVTRTGEKKLVAHMLLTSLVEPFALGAPGAMRK